jgi:putative SOS response-associated peptidase YedK
MCGLIKVRSREDPFVSEARIESERELFRGHDAKPSQELLVFRRHPSTGVPVEGRLRWGLIPHWMKARPEVRPTNARAETLKAKRMFSDAYARRRCVVPMDAFYERDKRRKLHAFAMKDHAAFGVAGIWENWRNPATTEWERTFAIVTVPPNDVVARVHDRMPAILRPEDHARWLGSEPDPHDLLKPYPAELMVMCS